MRPYGLSLYLFETYDMYEERMRTELQRWEAAGHVTKNSSDASSREHCKFTKPVICWCLYHGISRIGSGLKAGSYTRPLLSLLSLTAPGERIPQK